MGLFVGGSSIFLCLNNFYFNIKNIFKQIFTHILIYWKKFKLYNYFLNTNKYSWAININLYFTLFFFKYTVASQLCCSLIISSFNLNPAFSKIRITSNDIGIICPFSLVSPIKIAQNLSFLSTR